MNQQKLTQKINQLLVTPFLKDKTITKLKDFILNENDWDLFRLNPYLFAEKHQIHPEEAIYLFLNSVRAGLFDFSWNLICPSCGGIEHSYHQIDGLNKNEFFCSVCNQSVPANLDDWVEVSFSLNPHIKTLNVDPYQDYTAYSSFFFSKNFIASTDYAEYIQYAMKDFLVIQSQDQKSYQFLTKEGDFFRIISQDIHDQLFIHVDNDHASFREEIEINITPSGFEPKEVIIHPGLNRVNISSHLDHPCGAFFVLTDFARIYQILKNDPPRFKKFFTAKELLNNQTFRDLFKIQQLIPNLKLNVRSLTILFTDLKGSTALYDQAGDVYAYNLIKEHFLVLGEAVKNNSGAIIKTMGDAIMASFSAPEDGIKAALDMMDGMNQLNQKLKEKKTFLGLKIGLHEGPALTINNNGVLDYFGQTVNIAARVQGLANSSEIWISDSIHSCKDSKLLLNKHYQEKKHIVSLKGVLQQTVVYQYYK